jgi:hypothetical protein
MELSRRKPGVMLIPRGIRSRLSTSLVLGKSVPSVVRLCMLHNGFYPAISPQ